MSNAVTNAKSYKSKPGQRPSGNLHSQVSTRRHHVAAKASREAMSALPVTAPVEEAKAEESLISHLREFINGPEAKLAEARYEEFLNILSEQKETTDGLFQRFDDNFRAAMEQTEAQLNKQSEALRQLSVDLDTENRLTRQILDQNCQKLHEEQAAALLKLRDSTDKNIRSVQDQTFKNLSEMTASFNDFAAAFSKRRDEDMNAVMTALQQLGSDLRGEIADLRRRDMKEIGDAIMEIGERIGVQAQG